MVKKCAKTIRRPGMERLGLIGATMILIALLFPANISAYVLHGVEWDPAGFPVQYYVDTGTYPLGSFTGESAADITNAIVSAFNQWQTASGISFLRIFADPGDPGYIGSDAVRVSFTNLGAPGGTMGLTTRNWAGSYYIGNKIEFDDQETNWSLDDEGGLQIDFMGIALRQIGLAIGLNSSPVASAVMFPVLAEDDFSKSTLQPDDLAGVQDVYGGGTTGTPLPGPVWILLMGVACLIVSSEKNRIFAFRGPQRIASVDG